MNSNRLVLGNDSQADGSLKQNPVLPFPPFQPLAVLGINGGPRISRDTCMRVAPQLIKPQSETIMHSEHE